MTREVTTTMKQGTVLPRDKSWLTQWVGTGRVQQPEEEAVERQAANEALCGEPPYAVNLVVKIKPQPQPCQPVWIKKTQNCA